MYQLFEMADSGNCYKVRLCLAQLEIDYERIPTDILLGQSRTPAFLDRNPNGKVPVLVLPDGRTLSESNAMLCFLAERTHLMPSNPFQHALVMQWLFFEQYSHEPFIATNRFWRHLLKDESGHSEQIAANEPKGHAALAVMEQQLSNTDFFSTEGYSIADIALYAYTHVAGEGGYDLNPYPAINAWLTRVSSQPLHVAITD